MSDVTTTEIAGASEVRDWITLLKPRVLTLVVYTGIIGLLVAPGPMHPVLAVTAILCITIAAGAAGAMNMWYDRDIDAIMRRTVKRPIPTGRISADAALTYGVVLAVGSVALMGLATNWLAAGVLAFSIFFYVVIYTMGLKRRTAQNIVIGGAAGALPPVVGWAAVTGQVALEPMILFAIIFLWTPPHFWALAIVRKDDYARAGVPMLPNVASDRSTRLQILMYSVLLIPFGLAPVAMGFGGWLYGAVALAGGVMMVWWSYRIIRADEDGKLRKACWAMFGGSILYLFAVFAALLFEWAGSYAWHLLRGSLA